MAMRQRQTRRERLAAAAPADAKPKRKLTQEEQDEEDEKALEEWCEKWCGRVIRIITIGSMLWSLLTGVTEWAFRPPVLIDTVDLTGRSFVLTGATDGIGVEAARQLAHSGARITIGARNLTKGQALVESLRAASGNEQIEARALDLASLGSVSQFAADVLAKGEAVHGLLNVASSIEDACTHTTDGFEAVTQINYLAPVLLTRLLMPLLEESRDARLVYLACPHASQAKLDFEHLQPLEPDGAGKCSVLSRYATAKLMMVSYSMQFHRTRKGAGMGVTSNVFDPVAVHTPGYLAFNAIAKPASGRMRFGPQVLIRKVLGFIFSPILGPIGRYFSKMTMRTAVDGGNGLLHVATSPALKRASGKVYTLAGTGLTKRAGCTSPADQCGQGAIPAGAAQGATATKLWGETHLALESWLAAAPMAATPAKNTKPASEWDEE